MIVPLLTIVWALGAAGAMGLVIFYAEGWAEQAAGTLAALLWPVALAALLYLAGQDLRREWRTRRKAR